MCVCVMSVCLSVSLTESHVPMAAFPLNSLYSWECPWVLNPLPPKCWGYNVPPCLVDKMLGLDQLEKCFTNWAISQALFLGKYIFEIWCLFFALTKHTECVVATWMGLCGSGEKHDHAFSGRNVCIFFICLSAEFAKCTFWVHPRTRGQHLGLLPSHW